MSKVKIVYGYPIKITETMEIGKAFNGTNREGEIWLYNRKPIWSYTHIEGEKIEKPEPVIRETVGAWQKRIRKEKPICKGKDCNDIGYHIGGYCDGHYSMLHRYLRKSKMTLKEFNNKHRKGE